MLALAEDVAMAPSKESPYDHLTVLGPQALDLLCPVLDEDAWAVDCTVGGGGHTAALLETGAQVLAIDRDPAALTAVRERFGDEPRLHLVHGDFRDLVELVDSHAGGAVQAVLADLGVSSPQLDDPARGFSFRGAGPLDMRMDPSSGRPLSERLLEIDTRELARIIFEYGEERRSRAISRAIVQASEEGTLVDTAALADVVAGAVGGRRSHRIHPATRTFQALRIWVNDELGALDALLVALPRVLAPFGRAAIISFHSLEDRRVKQAFRSLSTGCICPPDLPVCGCGRIEVFERLTRRPITASDEETAHNRRARSARLRGIARREVDHG